MKDEVKRYLDFTEILVNNFDFFFFSVVPLLLLLPALLVTGQTRGSGGAPGEVHRGDRPGTEGRGDVDGVP